VGSLPAGPSGRYFCHSTKVPKNEGAQPLLGCVVCDYAEVVGLMHLTFVMRSEWGAVYAEQLVKV